MGVVERRVEQIDPGQIEARVIDQHVERPEPARGGLDRALRDRRIRDVTGYERDRVGDELGDQPVAGFLLSADGDDLRPLAGEGAADLEADPVRAPCDEGDLAA